MLSLAMLIKVVENEMVVWVERLNILSFRFWVCLGYA